MVSKKSIPANLREFVEMALQVVGEFSAQQTCEPVVETDPEDDSWWVRIPLYLEGDDTDSMLEHYEACVQRFVEIVPIEGRDRIRIDLQLIAA